ncbi:MAG: polyphosphate:AMP phosphotransferase, partial [Kofleriaceae bacterium]
MFESAELGHTIDKERYDKEEPELRHALLTAQYELVKQAKVSVVIILGGVDGAGKGETLNLLNEWMDPRHIQTNAMRPVTEDLAGRPMMYRFWRALPPRGRIGLFVGSWYSQPFIKRVYGDIKQAKFDQHIDQILRFERMLADEGTLILKFWLHLSKKGQRKRLERLAKKKKTAWRVSDTEWKHLEMYDQFLSVSEHMLRETSTAEAPWIVVEGSDERYRSLTVGMSVLQALRARISEPAKPRAVVAPPRIEPIDGISILDRLDLEHAIAKDDYEDQLASWQSRLNTLTRDKKFEKLSVV